MNITITTAPEYYGDDCTADLIKYAATLADSYIGDDLELATITATVRVPSYGPAYPAVPVATITIDYSGDGAA
jgi:hypothetical protein